MVFRVWVSGVRYGGTSEEGQVSGFRCQVRREINAKEARVEGRVSRVNPSSSDTRHSTLQMSEGKVKKSTRWALGTAFAVFIATTFLVGAAFAADAPVGVTNIFKPLSTPAQAIHEVSLLVLAICAAIFLVVGGLLAYTVVRFRWRPGDEGHEPPQIYGSNQLEFAWTVIPIVTVFVLFLATARTIYDVQGALPPADALNVTVVGHQWWWEIRYPELGIVTANEMHVPVSEARQSTADLPQARVGGCRA